MSTTINTPATTDSESGLGVIIGLVIAVAATVLFLLYGLPAIRSAANTDSLPTNSIEVTVPTPTPITAPPTTPTPTPTPVN